MQVTTSKKYLWVACGRLNNSFNDFWIYAIYLLKLGEVRSQKIQPEKWKLYFMNQVYCYMKQNNVRGKYKKILSTFSIFHFFDIDVGVLLNRDFKGKKSFWSIRWYSIYVLIYTHNTIHLVKEIIILLLYKENFHTVIEIQVESFWKTI